MGNILRQTRRVVILVAMVAPLFWSEFIVVIVFGIVSFFGVFCVFCIIFSLAVILLSPVLERIGQSPKEKDKYRMLLQHNIARLLVCLLYVYAVYVIYNSIDNSIFSYISMKGMDVVCLNNTRCSIVRKRDKLWEVVVYNNFYVKKRYYYSYIRECAYLRAAGFPVLKFEYKKCEESISTPLNPSPNEEI
jgi:hypothetical protein